jgi:hypothetical protein
MEIALHCNPAVRTTPPVSAAMKRGCSTRLSEIFWYCRSAVSSAISSGDVSRRQMRTWLDLRGGLFVVGQCRAKAAVVAIGSTTRSPASGLTG